MAILSFIYMKIIWWSKGLNCKFMSRIPCTRGAFETEHPITLTLLKINIPLVNFTLFRLTLKNDPHNIIQPHAKYQPWLIFC